MYKPEFQNPIRINQRGFLTGSAKRFVLTENKTDSLAFSIVLTDDVVEYTVYEGVMERVEEDGDVFYVGDFSSVTREGDYTVVAGGYQSRQFVIYDRAYDICQRTLLSYFTYQRCGHPLGWNGACHLDDGFIKETGEHVDLSGGYHQSCDLRKSPGGVSIGVLAMLRFAVKDDSEWGAILTRDEAAWACDYFVKTIQESGAMYNTLNAPFGWGGRKFYRSAAPSSAQWNVTSLLTVGASYFKDIDPERSARYLAAALRSFAYMTGEARPKEVYTHPDPYPRGMDPDYFYNQCRIGSTADLAYRMIAAADLYRATGEDRFLSDMRANLPLIVMQLGDGIGAHVLTRKDEPGRTVTSSCSYTWNPGGLLALCDAYELLGDEFDLKKKLAAAMKSASDLMDRSVWRKVRKLHSKADLDAPTGHPSPDHPCPTVREGLGRLTYVGNYTCGDIVLEGYTSEYESLDPAYGGSIGIFLARASKLLGEEKYMAYAQSVADIMLGGDELDSSRIRGIGYNHAPHWSYGQFFPSTPFIPGAVGVSYSKLDGTVEYDMPCVGMAMYLLSELK